MKLKLPNHWVKTNVSEFVREVKVRAMPENEQLNYIGLEHLKSGGGIEQIGDAKGLKSQKTVFKNGDVLYGKLRPYLNKHAIVSFDGICSTDILVYRASDDTQASWLNYFLGIQEVVNHLDSKSKGNSLPRVSPQEVGNLPIPLPPLPEQRRIVAKLDAAMERLRAAEAALAEAPALLEDFRRSVLHWAVTGRLTERWRGENHIEGAEEIQFQLKKLSKTQREYKQHEFDFLPDLPSQWSWIEIGEIEKFIGSGITPKGGSKTYLEEGIPFIRSQNVYPNGLILDDVAFISKKVHDDMSRSKIQERDVLLNITGASIGRSTYVPVGFGEANVNQHVCIIRLVDKIVPEFLATYLNSPIGQEMIDSLQRGVTRQGLNYDQIRSFKIPLLPIKEQEIILEKIDALFNFIFIVEELIKSGRQQLETLRQTLLTRAFRGELLTEAELAEVRAEADYAPAGILLEQIKEEKARLEKEMKKQRGAKREKKELRTKIVQPMSGLNIKQVLQAQMGKPMKASDVLKASKYGETKDIDGFYEELRQVVEIEKSVHAKVGSDQETYLSLNPSGTDAD